MLLPRKPDHTGCASVLLEHDLDVRQPEISIQNDHPFAHFAELNCQIDGHIDFPTPPLPEVTVMTLAVGRIWLFALMILSCSA